MTPPVNAIHRTLSSREEVVVAVFYPLDAVIDGHFIDTRAVCRMTLQPLEAVRTHWLADCQSQHTLLHVVTLRVEHRDSVNSTAPVHVVREPDGLELRELVRLSDDEAHGQAARLSGLLAAIDTSSGFLPGFEFL